MSDNHVIQDKELALEIYDIHSGPIFKFVWDKDKGLQIHPSSNRTSSYSKSGKKFEVVEVGRKRFFINHSDGHGHSIEIIGFTTGSNQHLILCNPDRFYTKTFKIPMDIMKMDFDYKDELLYSDICSRV